MDTIQPTPPVAEVTAEPQATAQNPPEDFSWFTNADPEAQAWMKEKGIHGYKKWNQENQKLVESQKKLDAALSRLSEKTPPQTDTELTLLKSQLGRLVEAGKLTHEEANSEYARAQAELSQPKPLTEDKLLEVLSKREIEKEMKLAEREILEKSNGMLDEDEVSALLDAYISKGMDVEEAKEKISGFFSKVEKSVKEGAKETARKVIETPGTTPILTPGTQPNPGEPRPETPEEMARRVIQIAKERAQRG